ncbi:MAG: agmatine deiminase family protein [Xanthomonadales bacterium]|nr:agmatine deiminase family protein [Xanthomonadales bacterium]
MMRPGGAIMTLNRRTFIGTAIAAMTVGRSALAAQPMAPGYFAPAEESPHARTWMCWPSTGSIYSGPAGYFESVQETLGRLALTIAEHEPVAMLVAAGNQSLAARLCGPKVELIDIQTDDMWARDSGPVFLRNQPGEVALLDLNFNGWGGKQEHRLDRKISASIAKLVSCPYFKSQVTGEGGGIEYDGEGTLILNESSWVNDNRNPGWSRENVEAELKQGLGVDKVIWLPGVRGKDITDAHIDGSVRIVRPGVLIMGTNPGDNTSDWALAGEEAKKILSKATDAKGRSFQIAEIPSAVDVRSTRDDFFSGYANYYVGNGAVYTPQFGDVKADAHALATLTRLFPDRTVVSLEVDRIYENGGGIHCVTQQQPAV